MVVNHKSNAEHSPGYDDGWWDSVLADELHHLPPAPRPARRTETLTNSAEEDWEMAKQLYYQDQIVSLDVTGHNRGGLLVEGDGLYGFVPFSHLVGMPGHTDANKREKELAAYHGRTLRLKVIECVPEDGRIVFSERAAQVEAGKRAELFGTLQVGHRIWGEVTNITDFGVFVDLGGVEGLIHISELSWGRVTHPGQVVHLHQRIEVQVLEVVAERCRIALSLKRLHSNPWETAERNFAVDQTVSAQVTAIVSYGAFARLSEGLEGLIHVSEIPLTPGKSIREILQEGQQINVRVLHLDAAHQRLGLSLRLDD